MKKSESREFIHFRSPFLSLVMAKRFPMIAQLGVESGGRTTRYSENNLLKPGLGATVSGIAIAKQLAESCHIEHAGDHVAYDLAGKQPDWEVRLLDERTFAVRVTKAVEKLNGEVFRFCFAPATAPVTVWGRFLSDAPYPSRRERTILNVPDVVRDFALPSFIHFPDFGGLKVTCATPGVFVRQTVKADASMTGLNLGWHNDSYHTVRVAAHHGSVDVSFHASSAVDQVELVFRVEEEHYPRIKGVNFEGPEWNGLRRCWQNAFTLNPDTLSMGDNPLLHGIAHLAMHFKSDMSLFTPPLLEGFTVQDVLRRQLEITFRDCVGDNGEVNGRYATPEGRGKSSDFSFFDANVSGLIALYNYVAATGDWSLIDENLANIARAGRFLMGLDGDGDGILELPYDGNHFREDRECRNWWDNFSFGHKDAFINLLAYRALGNLSELLSQSGESAEALEIEELRSKFATNFHRVFFNPETGVHAGWISADGRVHDYMFTFISSMAINEGLVEGELARGILNTLLGKLRAEGFGDWKWGIPGPLISVSESDVHIWDPMQRWGSYENGGFCGQTAYHFIQALYRSGMTKEADEILMTMTDTFEKEPTHSGVFPGYMKSVDWRTIEGQPCGYNYLADNYYFLLAAVTGKYGIPMPKAVRKKD